MIETRETEQLSDRMPVLPEMTFPNEMGITKIYSGKVRDVFSFKEDELLFVTTDRISAFDRVLGVIPGKGQILNTMSSWWFRQMKDVIPNHVIAVPDSNVMIAKKLTPVPIEVVVRGAITGVTDTSLWVSYQRAKPDNDGNRYVYGLLFPPGLKKNDILSRPVITPTTKALVGHDEKITEKEIVGKAIVSLDQWNSIRTAAITMFTRAQLIAQQKGFILVDTKMEFGIDENGKICVMDELFTPDSSRFWLAATVDERRRMGQEPDNYDKEYLRLAYKTRGYGSDGSIPLQVPEDIAQELSRRYITIFEGLTGQTFVLPQGDISLRICENLGEYI